MHTQGPSASMSFIEAAEQFLAVHSTTRDNHTIRYVASRTLEDWRNDLSMAAQFFGGMRLDQIEPYHFRSYQLRRDAGEGFVRRLGGVRRGWTEVPTRAGAATINDELDLVKRIMTEAGAWTPQHTARYNKLQEPDNDIPKAASDAEQAHFLSTARADEETHIVWWYGLVARATTFSSDEMRTLRQGDINFAQQILGVNRAHGKNQYRRRAVPIVDPDCMWALEQLDRRSVDLVGRGAANHLFPQRLVRGVYDGSRPTGRSGSLRGPHRTVVERAGMPWFTINCWRHTAITNLAVAGVPIAVIMDLAGHVSPKMTAHYTHICEQVKRQELERAFAQRKKPPQPARTFAAPQNWGATHGPGLIRTTLARA